ncbi:hypothetical protein WJX72_009245 [[Myrmecia] bisecta]|uniref:intramembrane prenyl-peptidase Rce1 n=1 Tax=[Myrmecia] bisecta TaxID=41462 RepID=A0AAW1Q3B9_9CHLO
MATGQQHGGPGNGNWFDKHVDNSLLAVLALLLKLAHTSTLRVLGLRWEGSLAASVVPLLLTALLFLGPLAQWALDGPHSKDGHYQSPRWLLAARNYVVGPITEEFVFRACMAPFLVLQGFSIRSTVLLTPLLFGVAHLHHCLELVRHQRCKISDAIPVLAVQFGYTTVFGWYATYLFLRTGHLLAPLVAHTFCNVMGFPAFQQVPSHRHAKMLSVLFVTGVASFTLLVGPATGPWLYRNVPLSGTGNLYFENLQQPAFT